MNLGSFLAGAAVGSVIGALVFYRVGEAVARGRRAWRDLVATKNSIRGLWARTLAEVGRAVKYALVGAALIVGTVAVLFAVVTH